MERTNNKFLMFGLAAGLIFCALVELLSFAAVKIYPSLVMTGFSGLERFEPGNMYFKPHHYYGLEINPEQKLNGVRVNNSYGLRGGEFPQEKEKGEFRIACLGGSTTQDDYPFMLEKALQQMYPARKIRVINGGVGTYTSAETLIAYLFKISYLHPDLIIDYEGVNDIFPQAYYKQCHPDYREYRRIWQLKGMKEPPAWFYKLKSHSYFFNILFTVIYRRSVGVWDYCLNYKQLNDDEALAKVNKPDYGTYFGNNIRKLVMLAKADKRKVLLVTFLLNKAVFTTQDSPRSLKRTPEAWLAANRKQNEMLRKIAGDSGVYLFDLANSPEFSKLDFPVLGDACHFTEVGNGWRVAKIAEYIKKNKIIE